MGYDELPPIKEVLGFYLSPSLFQLFYLINSVIRHINNPKRGRADVVTPVEPESLLALPPVLSCANTPEIARRVETFFHSVAAIFEAWINRRISEQTRRAYRCDVMAFVEFCKFAWPEDSAKLLRVSILDVQSFKDSMAKHSGAPKTINRRISSLSSF